MAEEIVCAITINNGATVAQLVAIDGLVTTLRVRNTFTRACALRVRGLTERSEAITRNAAQRDIALLALGLLMDRASLSLEPGV